MLTDKMLAELEITIMTGSANNQEQRVNKVIALLHKTSTTSENLSEDPFQLCIYIFLRILYSACSMISDIGTRGTGARAPIFCNKQRSAPFMFRNCPSSLIKKVPLKCRAPPKVLDASYVPEDDVYILDKKGQSVSLAPVNEIFAIF